jgi:hypothetical protein
MLDILWEIRCEINAYEKTSPKEIREAAFILEIRKKANQIVNWADDMEAKHVHNPT